MEIDTDAILLRAYGNNTDILIDRDQEAQSHALLAHLGLAPQLLARFDNGLLYKYIIGQVCTPPDLIRKEVWQATARRLAEWHSVPIPENYYANRSTNGVNGQAQETKTQQRMQVPNVWTVMQKWISALPSESSSCKIRKNQLQTELNRSIEELQYPDSFAVPAMIFGHCDLLSANVIMLPKKKQPQASESSEVTDVRFIDYEYATACPAAFDIANHFAEWGGYECDYAMLPSRSVRRSFLDEYVRALPESSGSTAQETNAIAEGLFNQIDEFRGMPGLYWGIWSLVQATISQIDFDYASYAEVRLGEYFAWREESNGDRSKAGKEVTLRESYWARVH